MRPAVTGERLRPAEVLAAVSLAIDLGLGLGQPMEASSPSDTPLPAVAT